MLFTAPAGNLQIHDSSVVFTLALMIPDCPLRDQIAADARAAVRKARRMAEQMQVPILGVAENTSAFVCPTCGTRHELFGSSHAGEITDAPPLARLAIAPDLATLGDAGSIESYESDQVAALTEAFLDVVPVRMSASS